MRRKTFSIKTLQNFSFVQRGQMLVFYALMIPVMMLFVGLAFDLGWYYLNVSRLQNAADAAALAGAKALMANNENFSEFKYTWLADNYSGDKDTTIDTSIGDAAAQSYANKNLSGNDAAAPITDEFTNKTVAHEETLYQDDEIKSEPFYYVVELEENVQHFFLPGWFGEMSAPVVAVATISKVAKKAAEQDVDPDDPDDPDNPNDDNPDDPPLPNIEDITGEEEDDDPDDPDKPENPSDPTTPTKTDEEIQQEEEQKKIEEGLSIYGAMKGNPNYDRKGLEEQMTYNTWWAIYKLGKDSNYCVYPDEGGSIYFTSKNYRTETTNINSSEVSAKKNNFTLFLDLGSDLMYEDSSGKGGLFNTSWDLANIATDGNGDTLTSIEAHANSGKLSSGTLTISSDGNTNNVYGYYSGSGWWKSLVDKLKFNFKNNSSLAYTDAVKYRVHTSFNFDAVFPVRSNRNKTTSPKYVNGYAVPATDPLYIRIEGEELNEADGDKQNTTARQMFININVDNTASNARPLIIFYEGPDRGLKEGYDDADVEGSTQTQSPKDAYPNLTRRTAQPVVLNLQADFKGILFAPSSPVIIKGNGHKMEGFVVAKNFVDFADKGDVQVTENGLTFYTDYYGNIQTKSLAANSIRKLNSSEQPLPSEASEFKKKYYATYEFAYNLSAFNLSDDSFYSSFDIPELERTVYTYLDNYKYINKAESVDMIFTTIRSKWIT